MRLLNRILGWTSRAGRLSRRHKGRQPASRLFCEPLEDRIAPALGNPMLTLNDPANGAGDTFGMSVAVSDQYVLVGAPSYFFGNPGAAYLFNTSGQLLQTFNAPSPSDDLFGYAVAIAGDDIAIGAPLTKDTNGKGAVYLYDTSGNLLQMLTSPGQYQFGVALAMSGSDLLVGADVGVGAADLYHTAGNLLQTFSNPNPGQADFYAIAVALAGNNVVIGASGMNNSAGVAYVYDTSGDLLYTLNDPTASSGDIFGYEVAVAGQDIAVGAPYVSSGQGAVYLYDLSSGNLLESLPNPGQHQFGIALAMSGSELLVGASGGAGAADLYDTAGDLVHSFSDPDPVDGTDYAGAVALAGNNILIGASNLNNATGAAYQYNLAGTTTALAGSNQTTPVGTAFGTLLETQVINAQGDPIGGADVTFTVNDGAGGAGATFPSGATTVAVRTNAQGLAYAPPLTANGTAGAFTVTASAGSFRSTFSLTITAGPPASIAVAGGSGQYGIVGTPYSLPLQALVTDADGNPVPGVLVTFAAPMIGPGGAFAGAATALTDGRGIATAPALIANHSRGGYQVVATAAGAAQPADFTLSNIAAPAAATITAGNNQTAPVYGTYATRLAVSVTDAYKQPIADLAVEFDVIPNASAAGAGASFQGAATVLTSAAGVATAPPLVADASLGTFTVEAWITGMTTPLVFTCTNSLGAAAMLVAVSGTPQSAATGTQYANALTVEVVTQSGKPVDNAAVTFTVVPAGGAGAGFGTSKSLTTSAIPSVLGYAIAPSLTANGTAGSFTVTAAVHGIAKPATFNLTNTAAAPARIVAVAGTTPQTVKAGQPFPTDLAVQVFDSQGDPISGAVVTFTVSGSPAPATFPNGSTTATASTGGTGTATAPKLTSIKGQTGAFTVTATVDGLSTVVTFDLTTD